MYRHRPGRYLTRCAALAVALFLSGAASAQVLETTADPGFWLPQDVSSAGHLIDQVFNIILYLTLGVGVAVFAVLMLFLVRYRHQPGRQARFLHGNTRLEAVWTLVPTMILALIAAYSQTTWSAMKSPDTMPSGDDVVRVQVTGRQFQWFFHYPGADGIFGRTDRLWRKNTGVPDREAGLMRGDLRDVLEPEDYARIAADPTYKDLLQPDPAANDDIVVGRMVVPVNRKVVAGLSSVDVIHSFYLPNFRVKQDAVPGLRTRAWFEATRTSAQVMGTSPDGPAEFGYAKPFDIVCAELCGQGHFKMRGMLYVVTEQEFQAFLKAEAEFQAVTPGTPGGAGEYY